MGKELGSCYSVLTISKKFFCLGWCGSVDWASACEPKGHRFDSWSGHMPGLWARSPVGGARGNQCFSPCLSPSFPLSLKINKILKKKKRSFSWICVESSCPRLERETDAYREKCIPPKEIMSGNCPGNQSPVGKPELCWPVAGGSVWETLEN